MCSNQVISFSILRSLLKDFDLGTIEKFTPLSTSGNIAYTVVISGEKYLLRLSPFGIRWRSKKEIEAEIELLNYLFSKGFPTPVPIVSKDGKQVISWNNHFGYLRKFVSAKPKLSPSLHEINEFGQLCGRFHNLVLNYKTKYEREHVWDLESTKENFEEDRKILLKKRFLRQKEFVKKFRKELFSLNFPKNLPSGLIHEDLGKRHVLWEKGKAVSVIDFDRSYCGKLVLDLGQACRGWCFSNNWETWSNKKFQALLSGYQKKRKLTNLEKEYLVDAIKFGILERAVSFCLRFVETTNDPKDLEYAFHSVSDDGLLGIIENNREEIEKFL